MKKLCDYQAGLNPDPELDIHTKYLTYDFLGKLRRVSEPIDIAGCKFTPNCAAALNILMGDGIVVRDSEDPVRDALLQNNFKAYREVPVRPEHLPNERVRSLAELKAYVQKLDPAVVYDVEGWSDIHMPLSILIQMGYPQFKFDYGVHLDRLFKSIHYNLYQRETNWFIENTDKFLMLYDQTYVEIPNTTRNMTTAFDVPFLGKRSWSDMLATTIFIPSYFGEISILRDKELTQHWGNVVRSCAISLESQSRLLLDLIKELQNDTT